MKRVAWNFIILLRHFRIGRLCFHSLVGANESKVRSLRTSAGCCTIQIYIEVLHARWVFFAFPREKGRVSQRASSLLKAFYRSRSISRNAKQTQVRVYPLRVSLNCVHIRENISRVHDPWWQNSLLDSNEFWTAIGIAAAKGASTNIYLKFYHRRATPDAARIEREVPSERRIEK